jgi:hypothetical protein
VYDNSIDNLKELPPDILERIIAMNVQIKNQKQLVEKLREPRKIYDDEKNAEKEQEKEKAEEEKTQKENKSEEENQDQEGEKQ